MEDPIHILISDVLEAFIQDTQEPYHVLFTRTLDRYRAGQAVQ